MWALVANGIVVETTDEDPTGKYAPELNWMPAPAGTPVGYLRSGDKFVPPQAPSIEDQRRRALDEINRQFEIAAAELTAGYPVTERLTWDVQRAEALAWQADPAAPTPYIDGLAAVRGLTQADMRERTLSQVQAFLAASQQLVGRRQKLADQIGRASKSSDLEKIVW